MDTTPGGVPSTRRETEGKFREERKGRLLPQHIADVGKDLPVLPHTMFERGELWIGKEISLGRNTVVSLLERTPISEILETKFLEGKISPLTPQSKISQAVDILSSDPSMYALPVMEDNKCLGLVSMLDVCAFVLKAVPSLEYLEADQLGTLRAAGRDLANESIMNIINLSERDPMIPMKDSDNALSCAKYFASGIHVLPVLMGSTVVGTVTQNSLLRWLSTTMAGESGKWGMKALQLGLGKGSVLALNHSRTVADAALTIWNNKVHGIALLEESGRLVGNFSISDLKNLVLKRWDNLLIPVVEYLRRYRPDSLNPICARDETTLGDVVNEMMENKINRLWVIDKDFKPCGVITMTDVIRCLLSMNDQAVGTTPK